MCFLGGRKCLRTGVNNIQSLSATTPVILIIEIPELMLTMLLRYDGLPLSLDIRLRHVLNRRPIYNSGLVVPLTIVTCYDVTECLAELPFEQALIAEPEHYDENVGGKYEDRRCWTRLIRVRHTPSRGYHRLCSETVCRQIRPCGMKIRRILQDTPFAEDGLNHTRSPTLTRA